MISTCDAHIAELISFVTDAATFQNSMFWNPDTTSGMGGWGDPNDDYQVADSAFGKDFIISYPVPLRHRRQYTLSVPGRPTSPSTNALIPESIVAIVNGFEGGFVGFRRF